MQRLSIYSKICNKLSLNIQEPIRPYTHTRIRKADHKYSRALYSALFYPALHDKALPECYNRRYSPIYSLIKVSSMGTINHQVILASRPKGNAVEDNFRLIETPLRDIEEGEVLIKNLYISLDAGFRFWMNEGSSNSVLPEMPLGAPVMGLTLGRVIESKNEAFDIDQLIMGRFSWESYSIASKAEEFAVPIPSDIDCPLSYHMGVLCDTGMSAYFGLKDIGKPKAGETVLVSGAGGAVGIVAGQIAKLHGANVIGTAGSEEKCRRLENEFGYDKVINYRSSNNLTESIEKACPNGVDVYFDNIAGPLLEAALNNITDGARVVLCGSVSTYESVEPLPGPSNLFNLVARQAKMEGFMCHYHADRYDQARRELLGWVNEGKIKNAEYMLEGIENTPKAFCDMFSGINFGKTLVKL